MIPIVCYSHSDYLDILNVQQTFLQQYTNPKYLCYNKNFETELFDKVLVYDDKLKYSKKLEQCLLQIQNEPFILFVHDMNIFVNMDTSILEKMVQIMKYQNIDRFDLRNNEKIPTILVEGENGLVELPRTEDYRYDVCPSIWKLESLLNILHKFDKCYRTIECKEVDMFVNDYKIYQIASKQTIQSAYFLLSRWFVYIHMTSCGKLIPKHNNGMCEELNTVYSNILNSFPFSRGMKNALYGYE